MEHILEQLRGALVYAPLEPGAQLVFQGTLFVTLFAAMYTLYTALSRTRARIYVLLAFSLYFYYKFSGPFVLLMLGTALLDWALGLALHRTRGDGARLALKYTSIGISLGLLGFFKYTNFFVQSWWSIAHPGTQAPVYDILLPIGISFYTFKSIHYILEVHGGEAPERNFFHYLTYISFFPGILAGPISRKDEVLPLLRQPLHLSRHDMGTAFFLFVKGLFKKIVIADFLAANFVNRVFASPDSYSGLENLMATYTYGFQLYADFSGYVDMALGVALLLGFGLQPNFNEPFKATNISDFWRRWHITLSTWFNDYVFLPLSFAWRSWGRVGTLLAVLLTFALSGLWHGPHWAYVLWGASHGLAIAYEVATGTLRKRLATALPRWLYTPLSVLLTYQFLAFTYILFQAAVLGKDMTYLGTMYGKIFTELDWALMPAFLQAYLWVVVVLALAILLHYLPTRWKQALQATWVRTPWLLQPLLLAMAVLLIYQIKSAAMLSFVYLQF